MGKLRYDYVLVIKINCTLESVIIKIFRFSTDTCGLDFTSNRYACGRNIIAFATVIIIASCSPTVSYDFMGKCK